MCDWSSDVCSSELAIAAARLAMVVRLQRACDEAEGPFPKAELALDGTVEAWLREGPALAAEDRLRDGLAPSRPQAAQSGGTAPGTPRPGRMVPHPIKGLAAELGMPGKMTPQPLHPLMATIRPTTQARGRRQ